MVDRDRTRRGGTGRPKNAGKNPRKNPGNPAGGAPGFFSSGDFADRLSQGKYFLKNIKIFIIYIIFKKYDLSI